MGCRNEQSRPQQINRKSHNGKLEKIERGRVHEKGTHSEQPQNLTVNWMTNCIGFINLTTGTSDRGPWHWLEMVCATNHDNKSHVMFQMWNNPHLLRYGWCYADSCSNIIKYTTDQSLIRSKMENVTKNLSKLLFGGPETNRSSLVCCLWQWLTSLGLQRYRREL